VPLAVAAVVAGLAFQASMQDQARTAINKDMRTAVAMVDDRIARTTATLDTNAALGDYRERLDGGAAPGLATELGQAATQAKATYVLLVDRSGVVIGSSRGPGGASMYGSSVVRDALAKRAGGSFEVLSAEEVARRGLEASTTLTVKPAPNATPHRDQVKGAMALVSAVPVMDTSRRVQGALVAVEVMNRSTGFVDELTTRLGGTAATVFQDEVRVSTSVRLDDGERAWGTPAADAIQKAVLADGKQYVGEASVVGRPYQTSYTPLLDPQGKTVGMLFVGFPLATYQQAQTTFLLRFLLATAVGLGMALTAGSFIARRLTAPLAAVNDAAQAVSAGDLHVTAPVGGTSETAAVGEAFNAMIAGLSDLITGASATSSRLRSISADLKAQSDLQVESTQRQASAVTETTATLEELAATYTSVAAGAEEVMRLAEDAVEAAQDGQTTVERSSKGLEQLFGGTIAVAHAAQGVTTASEEIAGAIFIIESIAEQTKILALNAAIEAARAGEAGKGFGVVAAEIRGLADSVSESTARIERMVREIREATRGLSDLATEQSGLAEQSVSFGQDTSRSFQSILDRMVSTAQAAREIAAASSQQRAASSQVVTAMHQVTQSQTDSATAARRVSEAAEGVAREGADLDERLRGFGA
jgi:methyl-accepting chemotaxis protein